MHSETPSEQSSSSPDPLSPSDRRVPRVLFPSDDDALHSATSLAEDPDLQPFSTAAAAFVLTKLGAAHAQDIEHGDLNVTLEQRRKQLHLPRATLHRILKGFHQPAPRSACLQAIPKPDAAAFQRHRRQLYRSTGARRGALNLINASPR